MKTSHLHWLLELMVVDPVPLGWLLPSFKRRHTNALPIPGYTSNEYSELLLSALSEGYVSFLQDDDDRTLSAEEAAVAVSQARHSERSRVDEVFLRLSGTGGKMWENLAEPRWGRFVRFEMTTLSSNLDDLRVSSLVASKNHDALTAYLGWYEFLHSVAVDWDTLRVENHAEYPFTYWKHVTDVHEAVFNGRLQKVDRSIPPAVLEWKMSLENWHTRPWNRSDWA